jgi:hypothetical protein
MGKGFRADDLNQSLHFPLSLHDWVPVNHLARFSQIAMPHRRFEEKTKNCPRLAVARLPDGFS